jgi:hypothetical protein
MERRGQNFAVVRRALRINKNRNKNPVNRDFCMATLMQIDPDIWDVSDSISLKPQLLE